MSPTCPVVLLIETLRERGFAPFSGLIKHELATQAFSTTAIVSRREYLQILLEWPRLGPKLAPMRSDEPLGVFRVLVEREGGTRRQARRFPQESFEG